MSIITIIFSLLANQAVLAQVLRLLAPVIGDLIGKSASGVEVRPADFLSGYDTRWTQSALKRLVAPDLVIDGDYGDDTIIAVKAFQTAHPPLKSDGVAGVQTIATLEVELEKTSAKV